MSNTIVGANHFRGFALGTTERHTEVFFKLDREFWWHVAISFVTDIVMIFTLTEKGSCSVFELLLGELFAFPIFSSELCTCFSV
jgi:hypothetical protein